MVSPGGVEAGGGQKVRWRTSQSSLSTSQSKTTAREQHRSTLGNNTYISYHREIHTGYRLK